MITGILLYMMTLNPCSTLPYYPEPVHRVQVNNHQLAYYESGAGSDTMLLVHGLGSNLSFWQYLIPYLASSAHIIAVDLPGYGLSSKEDVSGSMQDFAEILIAFMDTLKLKRVVLVGHSMGGQIAMTLALDHPERVKRLVLLAPAGIETFTPQEAQQIKAIFTPEAIAHATPEMIARNVALNFANYEPDRFGWIVEQRLALAQCPDFSAYARANARSVQGMLDEPVADRLSRLSLPTRVLWGDSDHLIPHPFFHPAWDRQEKTRELLPHAALRIIQGAGHLLYVEKPEEVAQAMLD